MRFVLILLFITLPLCAFSQGYKIKIGNSEFPTDKVPDNVTLPQRLNKFSIKKEVPDAVPKKYVVQIGEEEHSFISDGAYHDIEFSHDIKGLVVYVLNDKRNIQGKPFMLKKK